LAAAQSVLWRLHFARRHRPRRPAFARPGAPQRPNTGCGCEAAWSWAWRPWRT